MRVCRVLSGSSLFSQEGRRRPIHRRPGDARAGRRESSRRLFRLSGRGAEAVRIDRPVAAVTRRRRRVPSAPRRCSRCASENWAPPTAAIWRRPGSCTASAPATQQEIAPLLEVIDLFPWRAGAGRIRPAGFRPQHLCESRAADRGASSARGTRRAVGVCLDCVCLRLWRRADHGQRRHESADWHVGGSSAAGVSPRDVFHERYLRHRRRGRRRAALQRGPRSSTD